MALGPPFGSTPPPGVPPSPPPLAPQAAISAGPYVGNVGPSNPASSGSVSSATFGTNVAVGNGIVVFVSTLATSVLTLTDNLGNVYNKVGGSPYSCNGNEFLNGFWCPQSVGANPTITVHLGTSTKCVFWYVEIVGANPNWFIDGAIGSPSNGIGPTNQGPSLRTTSPNDLIVSGLTEGVGATAASLPAGNTVGLKTNGIGVGRLDVGWSNGTVANYTIAPLWNANNGAGNTAVITFAIRAAHQFPSQPNFTGLVPTRPPGWPVPSIPYPSTEQSAVSPNVTVALLGQAVSFLTGLLSPAIDTGLLGLSTISTAGLLGGTDADALVGQSAIFSAGSMTPSISVPLIGTATVSASGLLVPNLTLSLIGSSSVFSSGLLTPNLVIALLGQALTSAAGTMSAGADVTVVLVGQAGAFTSGTLVNQTAVPLIGIQIVSASGTLVPEGDVTVFLVGTSASFRSGTLSAPALAFQAPVGGHHKKYSPEIENLLSTRTLILKAWEHNLLPDKKAEKMLAQTDKKLKRRR